MVIGRREALEEEDYPTGKSTEAVHGRHDDIDIDELPSGQAAVYLGEERYESVEEMADDSRISASVDEIREILSRDEGDAAVIPEGQYAVDPKMPERNGVMNGGGLYQEE